MQNNRPITIYTARSRRDLRLQAAPMDVHELFSRLEQSQAIPYSCDAYKALPKAQQDDLKDIGAYIAGELQNGSRRNGCVLTRCGTLTTSRWVGPGISCGVSMAWAAATASTQRPSTAPARRVCVP